MTGKPEPWTAVPLAPVSRPIGRNDVGIVAWTMTLKTPECPTGRRVSPFACCESPLLFLSTVSRAIGRNDVGIVAWTMTLKTPECPTGRRMSTLLNETTQFWG